MTEVTLYMIIGFIFSMIIHLCDIFGPNRERDEKKSKEMMEFSPINMSITQLRILAFVLNILIWPVGLFMMIEGIITGNKDDD